MITIIVELTPEQAAGLKRFASSVSKNEANAALYPHVSAQIRAGQINDIIKALRRIEVALAKEQVSSFPWINTGSVA